MSQAAEDSDSTAGLQKLNVIADQSEQIHGVVAECAAELSTVNATLEETLASDRAQPALEVALEDALQQNQAVELKVQICAEDLTQVNQALKDEIQERQLLEQALASAHQQAETLRAAALHDPLTELPNRSLFNDRLQHGLAQAKRHGWTLAVMFIDLDGFKRINDAHGHLAGDQVLRVVASRLTRMTRVDDTVSRHGGDEFLYLLMELRCEADAAQIAEKIIAAIAEPILIETAGGPQPTCIRCSVGIAIYPRSGLSASVLVASADRAMYEAKRAGGGYAYDPAPRPLEAERGGPAPTQPGRRRR